MEDAKIVGLSTNPEYAKWAHRETDPENVSRKPEALDDMLVLDASHGSFAGLFASSLLAEMGAEVIRVEPPGGDPARKMTPYGMMIGDAGLGYIAEGRNKFHVTLDIASGGGEGAIPAACEESRRADPHLQAGVPGGPGAGVRSPS